MPLYDLKCTRCEHEFEAYSKINEREEVRCLKCKGACEVLITKSPPHRDWFRPHWNENIDYEPVYVRSKQHLKDLCLKNNLTCRALGDVRNIKEI